MTTTNPSIAELAGVQLGSRTVTYTERDAILYALAVGARADELELVYERDLRVLPTYGLALGLWAVEAAGDLGAYDRLRSLHAAQTLAVHEPLPRAGSLQMSASVAAVWDKGSAAMVDVALHCAQFDATYSIFLPGYGGWGGQRGTSVPHAERDATWRESSVETSPELAALYRLTGDAHPVHIDPQVAADYGFRRPILHGLCTLGLATCALAAATGAHPSDLDYLAARFAKPVYPGDSVTIATDGVAFEATVRGTPVLTGGQARFRTGP